jgi:hypothetical protein
MHDFQRIFDLLHRHFGRRCVLGSVSEMHEGDALIAQTPSPVERHALAGVGGGIVIACVGGRCE